MKINAGQASSTLIPEYIGSDFDAVLTCADNIEYIKNASANNGYTGATGYIGDTPPTQPKVGATWYCTLDGRTYTWYVDNDSSQWVESSPQGTANGSTGYTGDTPPTQPNNGAMWYCTLDGKTYTWYEDADSGQWVESSPQSGDAAPTDKMTLNAAATDLEATIALVNQIRAGLIANGFAQ